MQRASQHTKQLTWPLTVPLPSYPVSSLACSSSKDNDDHKLAYEQFRDVSVWRRGMDCRVPLTLLLNAASARK